MVGIPSPAYNNGFARGIDSNHRITSNRAAYLQTVAAGWIGEVVVMCAPQASVLPPQLAACAETDCPDIAPLGSGTNLVNVIVEIANTTATPIDLVIPAGQTFVATPNSHQDGLAIEALRLTIAPGTTGRFLLHLFCLQQTRAGSTAETTYALGPVTTNAQLLDVIALSAGKLGSALDPGTLSAIQRNLLVMLLATAADDLMTQFTLFEQFQATLSQQF